MRRAADTIATLEWAYRARTGLRGRELLRLPRPALGRDEPPILHQQRIDGFPQEILFRASHPAGQLVEQFDMHVVEIESDLLTERTSHQLILAANISSVNDILRDPG